MQLYHWSPNTFHAVWNAANCDVYVLRKDLSKPGPSPYVLDASLGDMPRSSIELQVKVKSDNPAGVVTHTVTLENYLDVPPPRTKRLNMIRKMIAEQHSNIIPNEDDIVSVDTCSFVDGTKLGSSIKNPNEQEYEAEMPKEESTGFACFRLTRK